MEVLYNYIEEHNLFLIKWIGKWDIKSYRMSMENFIGISEKVTIEKIIQDISQLDFNISFKEIDILVELRNEKIRNIYETVYITKKPLDVVFAQIYSDKSVDKGSYLYCRTIEKAIEILSLSISKKKLTKSFTMLEKDLKRM